MAKKLTISDLFKMKKEKRKIVMLSVYDATMAGLAERAGIDLVLVGDSLGMLVLGHPTTVPTTMDDIIRHGQAVRRGAPNTFFLACFPYQSYQTPDMAVRNAARLMQETGADAVKIQGGKRVRHIVQAIVDAGIPCVSHIGLIPHTVAFMGGFKVQAKTAEDAKRIYEDAFAIQEAGALGIEIEGIPGPIAEQITNDVDMITYGIGAGACCDGQVLLAWDMLGYFDGFQTKFVKRYANVAQEAVKAFLEFAQEVRDGIFPGAEHTYNIDENELMKFKKLIGKAQV